MNVLQTRYADKRYVKILRASRRKLALSRGALLLENLVRRFWPLWTLVLFAYAFIAFEGLGLFSLNVGRGLVALVLLTGLALLAYGIRGVRFPNRNAVIDRLDESGDGAPLASLRDHSATGSEDIFTRALWEEHQTQMAARARDLVPTPPDLRLAALDQYGLRLMALVCASLAVLFAPSGGVTSVKNALSLPMFGAASPTSVEAWATPPAYTGKPQVYLSEIADDVVLELPMGTQIVMQVYGGSDDLILNDTVSDAGVGFAGDSTTVRNATVSIKKSGSVEVIDGKSVLDTWRIIASRDYLPNVIITDELGQTTSGAMRLPFAATDDYGVIAGTMRITLDLESVDRRFGLKVAPVAREPLIASLPLPFRGPTDDISEVLVEDFSKDMWVGMPVTVTLLVRDAAGQMGEAQTIGALPGKHFFVPLAAAFAEQRRDLLWSPENDKRVLQVLKAMTYMPEDLALSSGTYLQVRSAIRRLEGMIEGGMSLEERAEIAEILWDIAVFLEDGDLGDARERLLRAQEKLLQAIEQNAEQEEISNLMEELREATDNYMEMLAAEAEQNQDTASENNAQQADGNDQLRQMLDELQRMAENGESEGARQLLEQMRQMLEDMQMAQQDGGNSEQMEQMQDTLNQQQELSDRTFQQLQEELENGEEGAPETAQELAERQEALRQFLESLQDQQDGAAKESTAEADENMEASRDYLGDGEFGQALNEQAEAIESLRESIRRLGEEMQQAGQGRDGLQEGDTQNNPAGDDPLGRPLGRTGTTESGETFVPDQNASERARELLDEIRRRSGDIDRPQAEKDYLNRLLERF